ncbi:MAG: glycosyltransferase [Pyrinomonadaceae bacterium]
MKIVRIIARLNVGGPARHVVWLTAGLQNAECESVLVTGVVPPGEDDMSYFAEANGVVPIIIPEMSREISLKDAVTVWKLYRLFVRLRPDIVHTHTAKAGTVGRVAGLLYRWLALSTLIGRPRSCRFVHTYHGHVFHSYYGALKTRVFLLIERILARTATNRLVVLSKQQLREIHEEFKVGRAEQLRIVPLGLDTRVFKDWRIRRNIVRDELGASPEDVLVGIVGRLTEVKNHKLFLRAAAQYKETRKFADESALKTRFVVIGDGHLRAELESEADSLGLVRSDDIVFLGTRDDAADFYPALDVVALSSLNEGTPLTLIEAMANARAVIATAVGGVVDLLGQEIAYDGNPYEETYAVCERGVLAPPNDADAFCKGLMRLIVDRGLRRELGERGRVFVEKYYSKERLLSDVKNLYGELSASESFTTGISTAARLPEKIGVRGERQRI